MDTNDFYNGIFVGFTQTWVGHPFDTYKAIKQTSINKTNITNYSILRLYRGIFPPLIGSGIFNSVQFGFHEYLYEKKYSHFQSGFIAGGISTLIIVPFDVYKINYQLMRNSCLKPKDLYRGFNITLARESIATGAYFGSYFYIMDKYSRNINTNFLSFFAGGTAGILGWIITYPLDTIKTRIMSYNANNIIEAYKMKKLWKGLEFCLLRAFIVNGTGFMMFNYLK